MATPGDITKLGDRVRAVYLDGTEVSAGAADGENP
jgi:hypothetical protein